MYFMSDPQTLHITRNVIPGKLGVDLHLHRVHIPLVLIWFDLLHYVPTPYGGALSVAGHRLSLHLSVCRIPDPKSRMDVLRKLKIGWKEAHDTGDQWPHLEAESSKVKVIRPISAETENVPYLPKERPTNFELGTPME